MLSVRFFFCSSYHVCVASSFLILVRAAAGVTSVVHIHLHSSRVPYSKMPVHWLSPFSELLLDSVQLCMLKVKIKIEYWHWKKKKIKNFIMQFTHHGILTFASICCHCSFTTALHVMQSLYMESYVTKVPFSFSQADKWCKVPKNGVLSGLQVY